MTLGLFMKCHPRQIKHQCLTNKDNECEKHQQKQQKKERKQTEEAPTKYFPFSNNANNWGEDV